MSDPAPPTPLTSATTPRNSYRAGMATGLGVVLLAGLVLGVADVMGKYYVPKLGAFIVYVLMIAILLWRPQGLFTRESRK